jgi:hypothetical protein
MFEFKGLLKIVFLSILPFASPPVMHFTPLAGLRTKNKNSTDILRIKE